MFSCLVVLFSTISSFWFLINSQLPRLWSCSRHGWEVQKVARHHAKGFHQASFHHHPPLHAMPCHAMHVIISSSSRHGTVWPRVVKASNIIIITCTIVIHPKGWHLFLAIQGQKMTLAVTIWEELVGGRGEGMWAILTDRSETWWRWQSLQIFSRATIFSICHAESVGGFF